LRANLSLSFSPYLAVFSPPPLHPLLRLPTVPEPLRIIQGAVRALVELTYPQTYFEEASCASAAALQSMTALFRARIDGLASAILGAPCMLPSMQARSAHTGRAVGEVTPRMEYAHSVVPLGAPHREMDCDFGSEGALDTDPGPDGEVTTTNTKRGVLTLSVEVAFDSISGMAGKMGRSGGGGRGVEEGGVGRGAQGREVAPCRSLTARPPTHVICRLKEIVAAYTQHRVSWSVMGLRQRLGLHVGRRRTIGGCSRALSGRRSIGASWEFMGSCSVGFVVHARAR